MSELVAYSAIYLTSFDNPVFCKLEDQKQLWCKQMWDTLAFALTI